MSRASKRILIVIGGAIGLLVLVALAVLLLVDVNRYKPRFERAASDALGMDVRIGGRLGLGFFPGLHVTVEDGRLLDGRGAVVATAKHASFGVELLPLVRNEFRLRRIKLTQLEVFVERDTGGRYNVEPLKKAGALMSVLEGGSVTLSDATLRYADLRTGAKIEATDFDLAVSRIRRSGGGSPQFSKGLSLEAEIACGEIRTKDLSVSALKLSAHEKDGVFELRPITLRLFGGQAAGDIRADFSGPIPFWQMHCSLPDFRIEEFLKTLSPNGAAKGAMDFSASLSMQGNALSQMVQTAAGQASLRGENLVLEGNDLDRELSRFESSQNFNLVDVGAVLLAGPLGLAVTKGYNFASLFRGAGGRSEIRTVVSVWRVEHGVARATDVALATSENRIALQGGLDFVHGRFADVTVAVVDAKGCAKVRQAIRGSFEAPVVEKPRVLASLGGPVIKLFKQTRGLFPAGPCEAFYAGSVAAPK